MIRALAKYKHTAVSSNINYLLIPVSIIPITIEGAEEFNKIYFAVKRLNLEKIERTKSGGIKQSRIIRPCWDVRSLRYCVEMTVIHDGNAWRIQFRTPTPEKLSGRKAFQQFKKLCLKYGIDLDDYAVENGVEIKKQIEKPMIGPPRKIYLDHEFRSVHHLDLHSAFPSALVETHPEFKEVIEKLYQDREKDENKKNILNFSIGFMQSVVGCGAKYAILARDAINRTNEKMRELSARLEKSGRTVLDYNTDGIWYQGKVYHGEGEGDFLGQWHNDHINCRFRMASAGCYEYEEDGVYYPVVRGIANEIKADWEWGDIYSEKAKVDIFTFTEEKGVKLYG